MDRIHATFERLRQGRAKALIPFLMGGDPDLRTTGELIRTVADAGADLIEVGVPFSDPLADGPTIQRASQRSLEHGTTPPKLFDTLARVSRQIPVPLVLLTYWNPLVRYGNGTSAVDPTPFIRQARRAGICGIVVPDLPPEEAEAFRQAAGRYQVDTVFLAAPTSSAQRLRQIARASQGFIYYVSLTGTTGARTHLSGELVHGVRQLKLLTTKPICVGFGISTPAQAASVARVADGVIVGSALLNALEPYRRQRRGLLRQARAFVARLRNAV